MYTNNSYKLFDGNNSKLGDVLRNFCLDIISKEYGYTYRKDWHYDLDNLGNKNNFYIASNKGTFIYLENGNKIIACGGLRGINTKQGQKEKFSDRYGDISKVGSFWRFYIEKKYQLKGIGQDICHLLEKEAISFGYTYIYLHCGNNNNVKLFWQKQGFKVFEEEKEENGDITFHMDKIL